MQAFTTLLKGSRGTSGTSLSLSEAVATLVAGGRGWHEEITLGRAVHVMYLSGVSKSIRVGTVLTTCATLKTTVVLRIDNSALLGLSRRFAGL